MLNNQKLQLQIPFFQLPVIQQVHPQIAPIVPLQLTLLVKLPMKRIALARKTKLSLYPQRMKQQIKTLQLLLITLLKIKHHNLKIAQPQILRIVQPIIRLIKPPQITIRHRLRILPQIRLVHHPTLLQIRLAHHQILLQVMLQKVRTLLQPILQSLKMQLLLNLTQLMQLPPKIPQHLPPTHLLRQTVPMPLLQLRIILQKVTLQSLLLGMLLVIHHLKQMQLQVELIRQAMQLELHQMELHLKTIKLHQMLLLPQM